MCKTTLGSSKKGLIFALARDINQITAAKFLGMMTKCMTRWLTNHGFSIGIDDVTPSEQLGHFKADLDPLGMRDHQENLELNPESYGFNVETDLES